MQDLLNFLSQHVELSLALIAIFIFIVIIEVTRARRQIFSLSPQATTYKINRENAVIVDIRPSENFQQGHIIDAKSFNAQEIWENPKLLDKFRAKPLIIVCARGTQSEKIAAFLLKHGYNAYSLAGGMQGWEETQMPVVKG